MINILEKDNTKDNLCATLNVLQNKVKYGVSSQTAISICEKIFNDRVLVSKISEILISNTIEPDIVLQVLKWFKEDVFALLRDYPAYFSERLNYLLR